MNDERTFGGHHIGFFVLIACGGLLLTTCRAAGVVEDFCCTVKFSLEVVNDASDQIRMQIEMLDLDDSHNWSTNISADDWTYSRRSGIFNLDRNAKLRFFASSGFVDPNDSPANFYLRSIGAVSFYEAGADIPYRGYVYLAFGCGVDLTDCEEFDDDSLIFHRSSDGATENLFVESSDRPFYLERDKEDPALGRLVVTFVPRGTFIKCRGGRPSIAWE